MATGNVLFVSQTDTGSDRIVAFWDMRGRESFVQVTNTSSEKITIHVQIFDIASPFLECEECNFNDMLSPNDTHVYNVQDIMTNQIFPPFTPMPSVPACTGITPNSYGFMVISYGGTSPNRPLIGMFRVIDDLGYEYRANAPGEDEFTKGDYSIVNFSSANGNNLSDLVGITYVSLDETNVLTAPGILATFDDILSWDAVEFDTSCSPTTFSCAVGNFDKAIDNSLPNSKGQINRLCASSQLDSFSSGWLDMPFTGFVCTDPRASSSTPLGICNKTGWFFGLVGLNNGDGTGSMDSWWQEEGR
jgi:hypothetical protein